MYEMTKPQKLIYNMEKYAGGAIAVICGNMIVKGNKKTEQLEAAVNALYQYNDVLRVRIIQTEHGMFQTVLEFIKQDIDIMHFDNQEALDLYANDYAKKTMDLFGSLCEIKIVLLKDCYGILVKLHHLIGDAWTLALICSRFNAYLAGGDANVYSYINYINNEKKYMQSVQYAKDKTFFLKQFEICEEVTYLSEKQSKSYVSNRITFSLNFRQSSQLTAYAASKHISVFALFMASFAVYRNRTKQNAEKFYIGTAVLNRAGARERNTMGMFINTVPVLILLDNEISFEENLLQVQENLFSVFRHQKYNYGELLAELRKTYHFTEKLYDVIISYQNASVTGALGAFKTTWYHNGMQAESLQIHIDDRDNNGMFRLHFDYQVEKFTEDEIKNMYQHITRLLFDAIENPDKKLHELKMLSEDEEYRLRFAFNDTAAAYPKDRCVHWLFEKQTAKTPDKAAVIACDKTVTYAELNERANRIAYSLIGKGVNVGDIVAFALPRTSDLIAVIFGIMKSGAAYMPIDLDTPQERIDYMLADSGAKLFITEEQIETLFQNEKVDNPTILMSGENLCYCIYTSGSTGKPKGVLIRHRNLVNFCSVNNYNNYQYNVITSRTILLSTFKSCFDAFEDYALYLLNGNSLVLANDNDMMDGNKLAKLAIEHNVGVIQSTSSIIKLLCSNLGYVNMLKQIKTIVMEGEAFLPELYSTLRTKTNAVIFNGYGPTEATIGVTFGELTSDDIHIGKPIANTQIYIVDKYMNLCPIGITGELCIAGDGVGVGYLNRPDLTAEKFIDNPFGKGKLYKTGDLAYWRADGNLAYVGRNDFQVKIHGLRIELGEIENAITGVKGVSQAVVVVRKNLKNRPIICAFYTGMEIEEEKIHHEIAKTLPRYMLPSAFIHLDEIPLTTNGKVNRKALPEVDFNHLENRTEYVKPEGVLEKQLAAIIGELLECDLVGRNNHFFDDLGGDSLKVIEFASKAHNEGIYFSVQTVFDCPTIRQLAEHISNVNTLTTDCRHENDSLVDYDFKKINQILEKNRIVPVAMPKQKETGNMLLTGATGYLGIHILADFLEHDSGTAVCLVRGLNDADSKKRLFELMTFYFGNRYDRLLDSRVEVLCADLQKDCFGLTKTAYENLSAKVDIVVNAAASVKHYGSYQYFLEMNVETVKRLIDFCMRYRKRLIHSSTLSVSGYGFENHGDRGKTEKLFNEHDLFIGQTLENVYIRSKFEAEKAVLTAILQGLCANIMRIGNLTNRMSDGVFQKNYDTNAFLKQIKAILALGVFPKELSGFPVEFTPVDEAARAIMTIVRHFDTEHTVFHINNPKTIRMDILFSYFREMGYGAEFVSQCRFAEMMQKNAEQKETEFVFEAFVQNMDKNGSLHLGGGIYADNVFSVQYLKKLGFEWSDIGLEYLQRYVAYFRKIGYLEG